MKIVSRFEFFESGLGLVAAKLGVISIDRLVTYDIYKTYRDLVDAGSSGEDARRLTVEKHGYHYSTIARAIYWFERDDSYKAHKFARLQVPAKESVK